MLQWLQPQYWRERRQARVAYQEAFRRLEADFYSYVLAKPDVRELLDVLDNEAGDLVLRTGRGYRLPPTLRLLHTIVKNLRSVGKLDADMDADMRDDMDVASSITREVTYRLEERDTNRRAAWIVALWVAAAVLAQWFLPR